MKYFVVNVFVTIPICFFLTMNAYNWKLFLTFDPEEMPDIQTVIK